MKETNDFIYGPLHIALRKQLHAGLNTPGNETGFTFANLLDHPAVRYPDPGEPALSAALLRDWLGLPTTDTTPQAQLLELFKLEAPLAVQSTTLPGFFPTNKFSPIPALTRAVRIAGAEADGIGPMADARKRLMIVPNCHVQELITETQADNWVRVTGVRLWQNGVSIDIPLAHRAMVAELRGHRAGYGGNHTGGAHLPSSSRLPGAPRSAWGQILSRICVPTSPYGIPRAAIAANLAATVIPSLQTSALLVKGKASNGRTLSFPDHRLVAWANSVPIPKPNSSRRFRTLEHLQDMRRGH